MLSAINNRPLLKSTTRRAHPRAVTAFSHLGKSRMVFLPSCLPRCLPQCLPTPPRPDLFQLWHHQHSSHCCCFCSSGLTLGLNLHRRTLVSLSVMAATVLCRQAVPSAWGYATVIHWLGQWWHCTRASGKAPCKRRQSITPEPGLSGRSMTLSPGGQRILQTEPLRSMRGRQSCSEEGWGGCRWHGKLLKLLLQSDPQHLQPRS